MPPQLPACRPKPPRSTDQLSQPSSRSPKLGQLEPAPAQRPLPPRARLSTGLPGLDNEPLPAFAADPARALVAVVCQGGPRRDCSSEIRPAAPLPELSPTLAGRRRSPASQPSVPPAALAPASPTTAEAPLPTLKRRTSAEAAAALLAAASLAPAKPAPLAAATLAVAPLALAPARAAEEPQAEEEAPSAGLDRRPAPTSAIRLADTSYRWHTDGNRAPRRISGQW